MIDLAVNITSLPVRQKEGEVVAQQFALSADDGANLADDDGQIMETYQNGSST